jgi:ubiquinone/menaquinone biosynthesis C-methylase UbiE
LSYYKEDWESQSEDDAKRKVLFRLKSKVFKERFKEEFEETGEKEARIIAKYVNSNSVVLDLGCGVGRVAKYLAPYVKELHGVDISEKMIHYARKNCSKIRNIHFKVNNGRDLSLHKNSKFDFVYSLLMLQHLEKEDAFNYITEIYRVLRNGGLSLIQFPNKHASIYWICSLYNLIDKKPSKMRLYTEREAKKALRKAGFSRLKRVPLTKNEINLLAEKRV